MADIYEFSFAILHSFIRTI